MDDENQVWRVMEPGRRWNGSRLEWRKEWHTEDEEKKEKDEIRMMREVLLLANYLEKDIQLTVDTPSDHADGKLPVLDLRMWMETREGERGNQYQEVMHEYYEKEMVAPRVIGKDSALPNKVKITTLTQEIIKIYKGYGMELLIDSVDSVSRTYQ